MATEPILAVLDVSAVQGRRIANSNVLFDYWELTKPEINFLIAVTAAAGFWLGSSAAFPHFLWMQFLYTLLSTILVASGAATLNQLIELRYDAQMRRTALRPLASGRIAPSHALWFGVLLSIFGVVYLAISTNALASLLAALTLLSYLFLYTPLKKRTPFCTLVGAFPGAIPPLLGWVGRPGTSMPFSPQAGTGTRPNVASNISRSSASGNAWPICFASVKWREWSSAFPATDAA